jgi:hypothetical protein
MDSIRTTNDGAEIHSTPWNMYKGKYPCSGAKFEWPKKNTVTLINKYFDILYMDNKLEKLLSFLLRKEQCRVVQIFEYFRNYWETKNFEVILLRLENRVQIVSINGNEALFKNSRRYPFTQHVEVDHQMRIIRD